MFLQKKSFLRRIYVYYLLLKYQENGPSLKQCITEDEKCVVYHNIKRMRSWRKKVMMMKEIFCDTDIKRIFFLKLIPGNTTKNFQQYYHYLDKLKDALKQKKDKIDQYKKYSVPPI